MAPLGESLPSARNPVALQATSRSELEFFPSAHTFDNQPSRQVPFHQTSSLMKVAKKAFPLMLFVTMMM
jgi:hypothetical protein